jgi:segregation and condensation protein A
LVVPVTIQSPASMSEYRVQFEVFEGPLDLLLHLVKKQEVDIYQVNLTQIATEFVAYLEQMKELDLEVAGEFLVMAATLLYIKSRELLPVDQQVKPEGDEEDDDDPRWELIRRLVEYKKFKDAAANLQTRELEQANIYGRRPARPEFPAPVEPRRGEVTLFDLVSAVSTILKRFHERADIREIHADPHTVSEKIEHLRSLIATSSRLRFSTLFAAARSRAEVVVTFLALLELIRLRQLIVTQSEDFGEIEIASAPPPEPPAAASATPAAPPAISATESPAAPPLHDLP